MDLASWRMKTQKIVKPLDSAALRRRAEKKVATGRAALREDLSSDDPWRIVHELQVHQIELEMQNRELLRARQNLEASQARYWDLYEFAPMGYLTLTEPGLILEANLTAAALLRVDRAGLIRQSLARFILPEDRAIYRQFQGLPAAPGSSPVCEVRMVRTDGVAFWARLEAAVSSSPNGGPARRLVMSDITKRKRLEQERELSIRVLDRINSTTNLRALMGEVAVMLREALGCDAVGIRLRDGEDFPYFETQGFPAAFVKAENGLCSRDDKGELARDRQGDPVMECLCGNVLRGRFDPAQPGFTSRGSFWTNRITKLPGGPSEAGPPTCARNRCHGEGYKSVALIPLRAGGDTLGLLQFNDRRPDRFSPEKIAHLEQLADHLASALARLQAEEGLSRSRQALRALMGRIDRDREDTRTRIAREIHDNLGHALTDLRLDLGWVARQLGKAGYSSRSALHKRIASMSQRVEGEMRFVREVATDLRPPVLDTLGLAAAIEWQAGQFYQRAGIACDLNVPDRLPALDSLKVTAMFRIFQEILANIVRHAQATRAEVRLTAQAGRLTLRVGDNGRGITPEQQSDPKALGLLGMRERAAAQGGEVTIEGARGRGTVVTVSLPILPP